MFDIGWSELVIIGIVALIAIGPKELPGVLRAVGQWTGKIRRMASEFQDQFREAMREAEVADLKRQFDEASAKAAAGFTNPLETAQQEVEKAFGSETSSTQAPADTAAAEPAVPLDVPAVHEAEREVAGAMPRIENEAPVDIKPDIKPGGSGTA
jgi:sec-independent protein translocase protein TatB